MQVTASENEQSLLLASYVENPVRKKWHDSAGVLRAQGRYRKGKQKGKWKFYYRNGCLKTRGRYKSGFRKGIWTYLQKCSILPLHSFKYEQGKKSPVR